MTIANSTLYQEVISENQKIFEKIQHHLKAATREILVATSWFTDDILFQLLIEKAKGGVAVDLIIADNPDNQKLNFEALSAAGANVLKIKNVGYGIMHQKFCLIDRQVAIHGSYNWSNNAKNNNHESVIVTNHAVTVDSLVKTFFNIKQRAIAILDGMDPDTLVTNEAEIPPDSATLPETNTARNDAPLEFTNVIRAMIAAETSVFDRELLRRSGYERAKSTNGDAQVLATALDSIYSNFVEDINIEEEKKKTLTTRIDELRVTTENSLDEKHRLQVKSIESEFQSTLSSQKLVIKNIEDSIALAENEIAGIKTVTMRQEQEKLLRLKEDLNERKREFVPPRIKYFEVVPVVILIMLVFSYLCLFYSSAGYILIFSETDIKQQLAAGTTPTPPQIFEPRALELVSDKGGTALPYILLFVAIPIALASIGSLIESKLWKNVFAVCLWLIDILVAFKISQAIKEAAYLIGDTDEHFHYIDVIFDVHFYLVFAFGILGLLLFKSLFSKMMRIMHDRHPETAFQKNEIYCAQLKDEIRSAEDHIANHFQKIQALEKNIIEKKQQVEANSLTVLTTPSQLAATIEKSELELRTSKETIRSIATIYTSYVERNRVPVHVDSIKDRINVFLEGWNDFLHAEYSVQRAKEKSRDAMEVVITWQNQKLVGTRVDHRISLN